jgi:hypothetical protein
VWLDGMSLVCLFQTRFAVGYGYDAAVEIQQLAIAQDGSIDD